MINTLWEVYPEDTSFNDEHLWIIAKNMQSAINKSTRWLIRNGYKPSIRKVQLNGYIDVF